MFIGQLFKLIVYNYEKDHRNDDEPAFASDADIGE